MDVRFNLNGCEIKAEVEPRMSLADFLRDRQKLTGTHLGCEHGICGACTVLFNGEAIRSCLMLAVRAQDASIITIEGLSQDNVLNPIQEAFRKHHALQCGYCTPGAIVTAHALLSEEPNASEDRIREVMAGNFCRCTGYIGIIKAVVEARDALKSKAEAHA